MKLAIQRTLSILFIFFFSVINSQEKKETISINANNLTTEEVIKLIENNSNYHFYFLKDWLTDEKVTFTFNNAKISDVLDTLFGGSTINYFVMDNHRIILTNGNLIKKSVYEIDDIENSDTSDTPVLVNTEGNNIIKIGKEVSNKKSSYTLSGRVINDKNGEPIEGVTIFERTKNIYATTDNKGYFKINLPFGENQLETSFVGFDSDYKNIIIYSDGKLNFSINEKSEQLEEVVINANRTRNIRQTIAGISQIKAKEIKKIPLVLGERDILKVAITLPAIKSTGEGSEGVNVRGGKVDQNLFLLDNGVIYNPTHFLGLFSAINPFTTNDLKIYTGNIPSEYGGRLSSVFDIRTKDPSTQKFQGEASIGPVTGNVNVDIPVVKDKSGLTLGVRSTYSDWILGLVNNKQIENSSVSFYDLIAKYKHQINDNNAIKATGYFSKDQFQIASDTINNYGNVMASLNWEHVFNDKNRGNIVVSHSRYAFDINYESDDTNKGFDLDYTISETDLKIKLQYDYSDTHKIDYGLESKLYNINPGTIKPNGENSTVVPLTIPEEKALENALFISDEITVNKKLNFNVGLRLNQYLALGPSVQREYQDNAPKNETTVVNTVSYDNNEIFKTYHGLSYRLSGRYALTNSLSLKGSFNKSFQYIHRLNNNTTATPIDTWRLSNTNIKPQEGTQLSFGAFKNINGNDYEISLEGYYKEYQNLLDYKIGANLLLNENIETEVLQGKGKSYGAEFLIKKNRGRLNGWLGYSYSRSLIQLDSQFNEERVNNGNFFPTNYDKPHDLTAVLNYKFTERYSFSTNFTYQTGRPITYPTGKFIFQGAEFLTYSNRNQFRIPDYYRLDIGINIEGNHKIKKFAHSFWNISVYNVLGRNNPYSVFFQTNADGNVEAYQSSIFSVPIPTITYNFKF
ncbi:outer membrane receptor for ferrienterochelin and colicin [Tenacibaculum skagerrakense]|uniref:Outer membrane receptor for ferrienterochelin and colicin n=1 Tax=Tenacibaculum skagerrakense TaxID=186571 RepID=A0A4R2NT84_9FLAO|nr:TonB-dependent receptor [Tenacibaculum skagerrakense]TCP24605.1 outer membrane receptor for ferrienterochelin and colicin [Tenacibaculum skagerrakense]